MQRRLTFLLFFATLLAATTAHADSEAPPRFVLLDATVTSAVAPSSTIVWEGGLGAGYLDRFFEYSAQISGSSAPLVTGRRTAVGLVPRFGAHLTYGDRDGALQPYIAGQVAAQSRSGAGLPARLGAAVGTEIGARLVGCDDDNGGFCYGISLGVRVTVNATDYLVGPALLPAGSVVISAPLTVSFGANL